MWAIIFEGRYDGRRCVAATYLTLDVATKARDTIRNTGGGHFSYIYIAKL